MKKLLLSAAAGLAATVGGIAPALAVNYDYGEARYTLTGEIDGDDVLGFGFEASRSFGEWLFGRVSADLYNVDSGDEDTPLDIFSIGPGMRVPLSAGGLGLELYGKASYYRIALANGVETDIGITAGLAAQVTDQVQARADVTSVDGSDVDLELYELSAAFAIDERTAITGSLLNGDVSVSGTETEMDNLLRIGVRFLF